MSSRRTRQEQLQDLKENPNVDVLVIGGGVNGIGTYRDLALQGVRVALVEKGDYCSGASAGSSHMLHGGIRYLENAEFRLVREALHERNLLLLNAPHYAKPLPTTIPMFRYFSGMLNAPLKFLNLRDKPTERGAIVIKLGLMMYDWFTGKDQTMPYHDFRLQGNTIGMFPKMNKKAIASATYYDAYMPSPERICIDMLDDVARDCPNALAFNYMEVTGADNNSVTVKDGKSDAEIQINPRVVVNAAGPWIDFVNQAMEAETRFIGGTKGSHIMVDNDELYEATNGHEIFFENQDGRIVLIFPFLGKVMIGTTDIRIEDPEQARCTPEEIDYMIDLVEKVFPDIPVKPEQIVFQFSGVRPLPAADKGYTGNISRDHTIKTVPAGKAHNFPIHSLVGGKWTSFRAFSEHTTDTVLADLKHKRHTSTRHLAIGGGLNFPVDDDSREQWIADVQQQTELEADHIATLLDRYGTRAKDIAKFMSEANDAPLENLPSYTQREIRFLINNEDVHHIEDILLRRSSIAIQGYVTQSSALVSELASIMSEALNWTESEAKVEIDHTRAILHDRHGIHA